MEYFSPIGITNRNYAHPYRTKPFPHMYAIQPSHFIIELNITHNPFLDLSDADFIFYGV